jgi:hypothetical protein
VLSRRGKLNYEERLMPRLTDRINGRRTALAVVFEKGCKIASLMIDGVESCGRLAAARISVVRFPNDLGVSVPDLTTGRRAFAPTGVCRSRTGMQGPAFTPGLNRQ